MTVTGWDNGLSQDYNKKLAQWFMSKPGAMHELRSQFMTTRTELIAELRSAFIDIEISAVIAKKIADMLEADGKDFTAYSGIIAARDTDINRLHGRLVKAHEAARLALEYLQMYQQYGPPMAFGNTTVFDAITALNGALK